MSGEGADDRAVVLELYKNAVEMADRVSARRAGANSYFLTLNTALAATVGVLSAAHKSVAKESVPSYDAFGLIATACAGIVVAIVWRMLLSYYRRLNKAKFEVINRLESELPAKPYTEEWRILQGDEAFGPKPRWSHPILLANHLRLKIGRGGATTVEQVVPLVFMAIYTALAIRVGLQSM